MASDLRRGQAGGTATFERYGREHMRAIGRQGGLKGGRPTWQETLRKAEQRHEEALQRARGRG